MTFQTSHSSSSSNIQFTWKYGDNFSQFFFLAFLSCSSFFAFHHAFILYAFNLSYNHLDFKTDHFARLTSKMIIYQFYSTHHVSHPKNHQDNHHFTMNNDKLDNVNWIREMHKDFETFWRTKKKSIKESIKVYHFFLLHFNHLFLSLILKAYCELNNCLSISIQALNFVQSKLPLDWFNFDIIKMHLFDDYAYLNRQQWKVFTLVCKVRSRL